MYRLLMALCAASVLAPAQNYPGHWTGRWIWLAGQPRPRNFFLMARGRVEVPAGFRSATLAITAANRYVLYLNGRYMGRGPARSGQFQKSYDSYDAGAALRPGGNLIAVLAYYYGQDNNYSRDERAGVFAQLDITDAGGRRVSAGTGRD